MKTLTVKLRGVSPLIMHNGQLANPGNPIVKEIKKVSGKRKKTDEDHKTMADLEWLGSLYVGSNRKLIIPGDVLEGSLIGAAKKVRLGTQFKSSVFVDGDCSFSYEGPQNIEDLQENPEFRLARLVVVQKSRILRTRPIFKSWSLVGKITFDENQINQEQIVDALKTAGSQVGLCDWRPKYGRFEVVEVSE